MRILSTLAVVAVLAIVPLAAHSQTRPADDHGAHRPAQAQPVPAAPGGMDMKGGATDGMKGGGMMGGDMSRMMTMMHGGMMGNMPLKHVEGRLAFLKTELKITPAQEPQWTKFADVVRSTAKNAQTAKPPMKHGDAKASTVSDRLAHYEKTLTARLETVRALKTAVDPLYASFSDEQKKLADELLMSPMGIM
ncbi:MAG: Spy/CpxP family protein refolding chaperone [Reyranella sp.]|uniref:Spy/CpxP family protein refolding chaperone n=1 Tax=Reyranella sp. TaxID=1929291 RepID=UPI0027312E42|nr:Spy/CpxP family protein refolding chaperone [Reyranella sp.]MDP1965278.1 Spy/CpxP family protein refolding chaperone [Reyranella sp.]MDP2372513.1 Spy/CpxP family protein refolding chaperone [Reyranella sp.]